MSPAVRRVLMAALVAGVPLGHVEAQTGRRVVVRVVSDSTAGVADADIVVFAPTSLSIGQGRTDSLGRVSIALPREMSGEATVTARKVGFAAASRTIPLSTTDSVFVELRLAHVAYALPTVTVDASSLRLERRPYIDAAEIAADKRSILSLADVVNKLRWDIAFQDKKCLARSRTGPVSRGPIPATRRGQLRGDELRMEVYVNGRWIPPEWDPGHLIHSEHIAEVRYVDCFDKSIPDLPQLPWGALYVTLKPGIDWDLKRGSFERHDVARSPISVPRSARLLGVYDDRSGDPLENVAVTDSTSGTTARTTVTGTVSLGFIPPGRSTILIHKTGFVDQSMVVQISPADTAPITVVLKHQPQ